MMTYLSETEWSWLAGFIDGEGTITAYRNSSRSYKGWHDYYPMIGICNTNRDILEWIERRFGGGIYIVKKVTNPDKHKQGWVWKSHGSRNVKALLTALLPYLRLKHNQAKLVLEFIETVHDNNHRKLSPEIVLDRDRIIRELRTLNRKGPVPLIQ